MDSSFFRWRVIDSWILSLHENSFWIIYSCVWWNLKLWNKNTWAHIVQQCSLYCEHLLRLRSSLQLGWSKSKWSSSYNSYLRHLLCWKLNCFWTWNWINLSSCACSGQCLSIWRKQSSHDYIQWCVLPSRSTTLRQISQFLLLSLANSLSHS